ncbi:MAG: AraC family transcriptional regulator [Chryseobacterium sp.]|nr:MAG: AraC family transcriptional regulator [Chryseobacterium sp.]
MVEIYNKLKVLSVEKKEIEILHNPPYVIGCTISETHRLLYFEREADEVVFVDFIPQQLSAKTLLFIPAHQLLYFPEMESDCYCIHIPQSCLSDIQQAYLMRLIYQKVKTIPAATIYPADFELDKLFNSLFRSDPLFLHSLPSLQYVHKAEALMALLKKTNVDFQLNTKRLAGSIHVSEKTLYRITKSVFNVAPSQLLNYYLQLKIIFRITIQKLHTFFDIADDLKCTDVSTFSRYVKAFYGLTPTEIRNKFYHLQL